MSDEHEKEEGNDSVDTGSVFSVLSKVKDPFDEDAFIKAFSDHIAALEVKHGVEKYTVIFLIDGQDEISSWHSNRIYKAASAANKSKDILLVILSRGGNIEPAYLISKTCKRLSAKNFVVSIPRKAKSAATLISLGADEIHMGLMSELGPIDPQINGYPALGIRNALEILTELSCKHPDSAPMLGDYLKSKLDLRVLGFFERINESAMQYAERLLAGKPIPSGKTPHDISDQFVNHYKDHGFVIDLDEAKELLGEDIVKQETAEYAFANEVYESFDFIRFALGLAVSKDIDVVGGGTSAIRVFEKPKRNP